MKFTKRWKTWRYINPIRIYSYIYIKKHATIYLYSIIQQIEDKRRKAKQSKNTRDLKLPSCVGHTFAISIHTYNTGLFNAVRAHNGCLEALLHASALRVKVRVFWCVCMSVYVCVREKWNVVEVRGCRDEVGREFFEIFRGLMGEIEYKELGHSAMCVLWGWWWWNIRVGCGPVGALSSGFCPCRWKI